MTTTVDKRRAWLRIVLEEGLNLGVLSPEDVLRYADPSVLATDLPPQLVASLLQAGLDAGSFNPALLVGHLGSTSLAQHMPLSVIWGCVSEAGQTIVREHPLTRQSDATPTPDVADVPPGIPPEESPDIEVVIDE